MIKLRQEAKDSSSSDSIKLVKDKLILNNKVNTQGFESNPLKFSTPTDDVLRFDAIQHSARTKVKNSIFQGHFHQFTPRKKLSRSLELYIRMK